MGVTVVYPAIVTLEIEEILTAVSDDEYNTTDEVFDKYISVAYSIDMVKSLPPTHVCY